MFAPLILAATLISSATPATVELELAGITRCETVTPLLTKGWSRKRDGDYTIALPQGFVPIEAKFVHGGAAWADGKRGAHITYGIWSRQSFADASLCRSMVGDVHVLVAEWKDKKEASVAIWYLLGNGAHDPVAGARSTQPKDRELLLTIARSLQLRKK